MNEANEGKVSIPWKLTLGFIVLFCAVAAAQTTTYTVTDLGTLGGTFSDTGGVNIRGQVAGGSTLTNDTAIHAFLWSKGEMKDLGTLGGPNSFANYVGNTSAVVGLSDISTAPGDPAICYEEFFGTTNQCHAFVWKNGVMTDLGTLGGLNSAIVGAGINDWGQVAGIAETNDMDPNNPGFQVIHGFLWNAGVMTDLGSLAKGDSLTESVAIGINDFGQVVGQSNTTSTPQSSCGGCLPSHAFLWTWGVMKDLGTLSGANYSAGIVINNLGQIVGWSTLAGDAHNHAILWQGRRMTDLGTLPGDTDSNATYINDMGQIVGVSCGPAACAGVIWQHGVITDLNTVIPSNSGLYLVTAYVINAGGRIVGTAVNGTGETHAYLATPVRRGTAQPSPKFTPPENVRRMQQQRMQMRGFKGTLVRPQ